MQHNYEPLWKLQELMQWQQGGHCGGYDGSQELPCGQGNCDMGPKNSCCSLPIEFFSGNFFHRLGDKWNPPTECCCHYKTSALFLTSSQTQCVHKCNIPCPVFFDRCHVDKCIDIAPGGKKLLITDSGLYQCLLTLQVFIPKGRENCSCSCIPKKYNFRAFIEVSGCALESGNQAVWIEEGCHHVLYNNYMVYLRKGDWLTIMMASDNERAEIRPVNTCGAEPFVPSAKLSMIQL